MEKIFSFVIFLCAIAVPLCASAPQVKISDGELRGVHMKSRDGKTYSAFMGIPYAKTPKRFQLAEPPEAWDQIRDATKFGDICIQRILFDPKGTIGGSENCLFINVYSSNLKGKLPVMIFIHGGSFSKGSGDDYPANYFIDEDLIFVTLNYRLGPLGFLSTGDGTVEPNLGLKDQNLALKWVQKNIHAFGGDPTRITLFGESAGSACVHHHVVSPMSEGLFQQAILQSGSALNAWAFTEKPETFASVLGIKLGCSTDTSKELVECLQQKSATEIMGAKLEEWHVDPIVPFPPSVEKVGKSKEIFLPDTPINILKSGKFNKVPLIISICEDEGMLLHSIPIIANEKLRKDLNEDFERVMPITLMYKYDDNYSGSEQKRISKEIKEFYFGDKEVGVSTFKELTNMYSDRGFIHGIEQALAIHVKHGPVFIGVFAYKAQVSLLTLLYKLPKAPGVSHGDDILFFFGSDKFYIFPKNTKDEMASRYFVNLWATFATTGIPGLEWANVAWNPTTETDMKTTGPKWFNLDFPPTVLDNPFKERVQFWERVLNMNKSSKDEL